MTEPEIGQEILHYRVLSQLGRGGMGAVYLAEDTKLHRKVALKFLPAEMTADPERLERFEREAQTVAALNHPNIVTIYSVEDVQGVPFIVMELVEGRTLNQLIPPEGLAVESIFDIAIPIADAIHAAHEKGISHRDLKPGNIMVTEDNRVKVLDFGLAKLFQDAETAEATQHSAHTLTQAGHAIGTVTYMAPEQLKGKAPDQRADIFSLGIVLYQMASGRRPFQGETSAEIISSILRDSPPPVTDLKLELPSHLARIVKRCLEKNPNHRYQSAAELRSELAELRREIASGTAFGDAKTRAVRVRRTAHRRPGVPTVLGGVALLAILIATWATFSLWQPDQQTTTDTAIPTVAVLPFRSVGEGAEQGFADGLSEELSSQLTSLPDLQVVSRATARRQFLPEATTREIGQALGADYLILGTVRWGETIDEIDTARANLQVIRVADDIQIWSDSYDRRLFDELAVQTEIALHTVRAVGESVLGLQGDQLPPEPDRVEPPRLAQAPPPVAEAESPTRPEPAVPDTETRSAQSVSSAASGVVTEDESNVGLQDPPADSVTLAIELTTFEAEGVLTVYADGRQVLSEDFHFEGRRRGLLGRRKAAGSLSAKQLVPIDTRSLRIYLLVGNQTRLVSLDPSFQPGSSPRLEILLNRKGELEARLR